MDIKRRKFLKMTGAAALAGVAAPALLRPDSAQASGGHQAASAHGEEAGGIHYGMVFDMRKLYGKPELIDRAIDACNKVHNIPQIDSSRNEVKWIFTAPFANAFPEHSNSHMSDEMKENEFPVMCNHCENPPCVRVCPTKATFVEHKNGIVEMDYHRCIGCRFCMVACPYGARSFNWEDPRPFIKEYNHEFPTRMRGVVEKCTFCAERLALGQEPACLEAIKETGAITFGDLNDPNSEIRKVLAKNPTIQRKPSYGTKPSVFYIV